MALFHQRPDSHHEGASAPIEQYVSCPLPIGLIPADEGSRFNPYSDNGGTILAIAGKDFAVVAGDTRQSEGYSIQTRYARKVWQL